MSNINSRAKFDYIRYAQVWEDADILNEALGDSTDGGRLLSVASAGDNVLAMLLLNPSHIDAIDLNPTQLFALELRIAAISTLNHSQFLELMGAVNSSRRQQLFDKIAPHLSEAARDFWKNQAIANERGYANAGKFENYFRLFREKLLPLVHSKKTILQLLEPMTIEQRHDFYHKKWNSWRWRGLFKLFFSRFIMGRLGRDPEFFKYVEGSVATRILERAKHAIIQLPPAQNPYLQTILLGRQRDALPLAWRAEHYEKIRQRIHKINIHCQPIEAFLATQSQPYDGFNLSDIFEYMDDEEYEHSLACIHDHAALGARLVYWNMLVPRSRPDSMQKLLCPLSEIAEQLHLQDKAFFYSRFVVEEKIA